MPAEQPNILVIWGDDIGMSNLSSYSNGVMGYRTPHIDRIAERVDCSPTTTVNRAARLVGPRSSAVRTPSAPG
jgi:hypothetical protein